MGVISASFFEGEFTVLQGGKQKRVGFRILDTNSNGCFNDYGTDSLEMDLNGDGYFRKKECNQLAEYLVPGPDKKQRLRLIVLPLPAKIAVIYALQEYDLTTLEPASEPAIESDESSTEPTTESDESSAKPATESGKSSSGPAEQSNE